MNKLARIWLPLLLVIALVGASFAAGFSVSRIVSPDAPSASQDLGLVAEAWDIVFNDYVEKAKLDPQALSRGAIKGIVDALQDPYSAFIEADSYRLEHAHFEGMFSGIGATVGSKDGQIIVVSPIPGGPAERAGIRSGDVILEINGVSTKDMDWVEAILQIRGDIGTQVTLRLLHQGNETPEDIVVTREEIKLDSVYPEMLSDNIARIRLTYFSSRTEAELALALQELEDKDAAGIILDLRNNPGGTLDAAVGVASQFLREGLVLYAMDNTGNKQTWEVKPGGLALDLPLAVLVNGDSASASEVVSGALQDNGRGPLIGTKTLGKGSINHFRELSDGSAIYITFGRWYTPKGRLIEGQGLSPDIVVERTDEDIEQNADPQLDRAIEYLKSPR